MSNAENSPFFPILQRREKYTAREDGAYYNYSYYQDEISEDCKHRCVYCDITYEEIGYEGMELDHFRPQKYFEALANVPHNLVLSCPKCNRLKSNHWPIDMKSNLTHDDQCGFIDPFAEHTIDYFDIGDDGFLSAKKPPAAYIEKLLQLNRFARKQVRYLRILTSIFEKRFDELKSEHQADVADWENGKLSNKEFAECCKEYDRKLSIIQDLIKSGKKR